jgi:hypothetical protein
MSPSRPNPLVRALPSLTDLAFLMPVVFLFARMNGAGSMLSDGDTGWHIRAGDWILANGRVPDRDIFSFTKAGEPWFAWEWLWDVSFAWIHRLAGMEAVVLASILVIAVTFALLYRLARRRCNNVLIAFVVTIVAAAGSSIHWLARPHLFTLLFLVVFYSLLERVREADPSLSRAARRRLALLPLLAVLWSNLHGGFLVGIALVGCYAAGECAAALLAPAQGERRRALARARWYGLAAAGCGAASFVNPYFYRLHLHIAAYLTDDFHHRHINEFLSLSFQHPVARFFEPMLLAGAAAVLWGLCRKRFIEALLVAGSAHMGLLSVRNVPIFLIVAAPVVAVAVGEWLAALPQAPVAGWLRRAVGRLDRLARETGQVDRIARWHLTSAAAVALLAALFYAPAPPTRFRAEYDPRAYPAGALGVLRQPESTRIFTNDEWGDYLIYRLYPHTRVFVDGRSDFYGSRFGEQYLDVLAVKYGWEAYLNGFGIDTILLPPDAPLSGALKESRRWRAVYDDGTAIVFRGGSGATAAGRQVSATRASGGADRDRKVTRLKPRDPTITPPHTLGANI